MWHRSKVFYLFLILSAALTIRTVDLAERWLWYDELQSVTHSSLAVDNLLKSVDVFDPHPPLYYLQLHYWMQVDTSDGWIKFNSVLWSLLTLVMIYRLCKDLFGLNVAMVAATIFAVSPLAVFYAQEARMYAWLMFLGVSCIFYLNRFMDRQHWLDLVIATSCLVGFLYSHGAGFLLLASVGSYAVWRVVQSPMRQWQTISAMGSALLLATILYLPWLRSAVSISVGHTIKPDFHDVIRTVFVLIFGFGYRAVSFVGWIEWISITLTALAVGMVFRYSKKSQGIVIGFVVVPIVGAILVSYLYRPIWIHRTLAYTLPFLSILFAVFVTRAAVVGSTSRFPVVWKRAGLAVLLTGVLLFSTLLQQATYSNPWRFRDAAQFLQSVAQPGDLVYVADRRVFWALAWYFIGPGSVNPLTTDYRLVSSSNVTLLSSSETLPEGDKRVLYLVYRSRDNISQFSIDPRAPMWDWHDLKVVQLAQ